jgi:hypothetical protein
LIWNRRPLPLWVDLDSVGSEVACGSHVVILIDGLYPGSQYGFGISLRASSRCCHVATSVAIAATAAATEGQQGQSGDDEAEAHS